MAVGDEIIGCGRDAAANSGLGDPVVKAEMLMSGHFTLSDVAILLGDPGTDRE
jgi:hypothetical protein